MDNLNEELYHWGIKGMKWGIRRFQKKDGSLTPAGRKRRKGIVDDRSDDEKRAELLKSTNASDLYKNRHLLTTAEINERMNRIDTERRLSELATKNKKTGMDYVDKALKIGRKVNEVYEFTNTPVMKELKKKINGEVEKPKRLTLEEAYKKRDKLSDKELNEVLNRSNLEKNIKKALDGDDIKKALGLKDAYNNREKLSDNDLSDALKRATTEKTLKKYLDELIEEEKKKED